MTIDWTRVVTAEAAGAAALEEARAAAAARLIGAIDAFALAVTGTIPAAEMASWPAKEAAARATVAGTAAPADAALLAAEAEVTGEAPGDLARIVCDRADALRAIAARLAGVRRKALAAFAAAGDPDAVAVALGAALEAIDSIGEG